MVYVDKLIPCIPTHDWPFRFSCHMVADSVDELMEFAVDKMGLKREWFQYKSKSIPHFDLGVKNRIKAIELGAKPIDNRKLMELVRRYRGLS